MNRAIPAEKGRRNGFFVLAGATARTVPPSPFQEHRMRRGTHTRDENAAMGLRPILCCAKVPHQSASLTAVSLRLGHATALTCPRQVIHYRGVASLPKGSHSLVPPAGGCLPLGEGGAQRRMRDNAHFHPLCAWPRLMRCSFVFRGHKDKRTVPAS